MATRHNVEGTCKTTWAFDSKEEHIVVDRVERLRQRNTGSRHWDNFFAVFDSEFYDRGLLVRDLHLGTINTGLRSERLAEFNPIPSVIGEPVDGDAEVSDSTAAKRRRRIRDKLLAMEAKCRNRLIREYLRRAACCSIAPMSTTARDPDPGAAAASGLPHPDQGELPQLVDLVPASSAPVPATHVPDADPEPIQVVAAASAGEAPLTVDVARRLLGKTTTQELLERILGVLPPTGLLELLEGGDLPPGVADTAIGKYLDAHGG